MKIFYGDQFLTPEYMINILRDIARDDAEKGEYHPEEHTCWLASVMIERMNDALEGKAPHLWLMEVAEKMRWDYVKDRLEEHTE